MPCWPQSLGIQEAMKGLEVAAAAAAPARPKPAPRKHKTYEIEVRPIVFFTAAAVSHS